MADPTEPRLKRKYLTQPITRLRTKKDGASVKKLKAISLRPRRRAWGPF